MGSQVATGLFSLGGVALGGLLSYGAQFSIATRAERRQSRAFQRLISEELLRMYCGLALLGDRDVKDWANLLRSETPVWLKYREQAAPFGGAKWASIRTAYSACALFAEVVAAFKEGGVATEQPVRDVHDITLRSMRKTLRSLGISTKVVDELAPSREPGGPGGIGAGLA